MDCLRRWNLLVQQIQKITQIPTPHTSEVFPSQGLSAEEEGSSSTTEVSSLSSSSRTNPPLSPPLRRTSRQTNLNWLKNRSKICKKSAGFAIAQTSRFNLDGVPAVEETSMSRRNLDIDDIRSTTTIIPVWRRRSEELPKVHLQPACPAPKSSSNTASAWSSSGGLLKRIIVFQLARRRGGFTPIIFFYSTHPYSISSLTISECCQNSLSSDGCLIATTTSTFDLGLLRRSGLF